MPDKKLSTIISKHAKLLSDTLRHTRSLEKLSAEASPDLGALAKSLSALRGCLDKLNVEEFPVQDLDQLVTGLEERLSQQTREAATKFGSLLADVLEPIGLKLTGQAPDLKAGIFTLELAPERHKVAIWYGTKQEKLALCSMVPESVGKALVEARDGMGSNIEASDFGQLITQAMSRAAGSCTDGGQLQAPIIEVLAELQILRQSKSFLADPSSGAFKPYRRVDFSFDLYRKARKAGVHLVVATQIKTKRRSDFLWIPTDENGAGTTYSHIRIDKERSSAA